MNTAAKTKRVKQVFNNSQLAHVWSTQTQDYGRNSNRSMFFDDTEIYSYGYHYCIAKIYPEYGNVVLLNENSYSPSTAGHRSHVAGAVSHRLTFYVPKPKDLKDSIQELGDRLTEQLFDVFSQLKPYVDVDTHFDDYNALCTAVGRIDLCLSIPADLKDLLNEHVEYRKQRNETLERKRQLKRRRENVNNKYNVNIDRSQAKIRERLAEKQELRDWLDGKLSGYGYYHTNIDLVRVNGDRVETTGGAEVPLREAMKLLRAIDLGIDVTGRRVGHFTVDAIELVNNRIEIGCHSIAIGQARQVLKPYLNRSELKLVTEQGGDQ